MKHLFLLFFLSLSYVCFSQIEYVNENDINFKDIVEKKGLLYFKVDTTLVTGRVVRFNRKNEAKSYVYVVDGKPQNQNWTIFREDTKGMEDSALGNILLGTAFATGIAMAITGNDIDVPIGENTNPKIKNFYKDIGVYNENLLYENLNTIPISDKYKPNDEHYGEYYNENKFQKTENYIESKEDGIWEEYYENEQLKSRVNYLNGKKVGQLNTYHSNGQLQGRVNYVDGKEDGEMMVYNEIGEIMIIGFFKEGKQAGEWNYFENGKLIQTENFD